MKYCFFMNKYYELDADTREKTQSIHNFISFICFQWRRMKGKMIESDQYFCKFWANIERIRKNGKIESKNNTD